MDKRTIIAIALCVGVLVVWTQLLAPKPQPPSATPPAGQMTPPPPAPTTPPTLLPGTPSAAAPGTAAPVTNRPERLVEINTPEVRFVFSSLGGTLLHAQLKEKQFLDRDGDPTSGHDVVRATDAADAPMRTTFQKSGFPTPADGAWETSQPTPESVVFAADVGAVHIEKRYTLDKPRYRLHLDVVVANRGDSDLGSDLTIAIGGRQDPNKKGGGFFSGVSANISAAVCWSNNNRNAERKAIENLGKDTIKESDGGPTVGWIAADEKFFMVAAVPFVQMLPEQRLCAAHATGVDAGVVTLWFSEQVVKAKSEISYPFALFAGPKFTDDLEAVQAPARPATMAPPAAAAPANLDKSVDVTFAWLAGTILTLLRFFHRFAHNWGLAIVLLTLFIKAVTFYPTQKSLLSAKKMQKLAPKMAAIRKKYENDRQRQSVETMNLYKAHGVSPFGGCLPSLIQMPIWIALYSTLNYAVELYRAPFIFHLHDLTAKDPYYVTPLVMGGVMFAQMKMSPAGADPQQQAMMSVMMPLMFTVFSLFLPSGLAVYMLTSYLFGILQQLYVNRLDRKGKITL
ncbi:MAG TPA: membrane protein insertase YidC [Polyangia bacterium]|nr:membrane protein insertase YidC [Polyangia bacterium]